MQYSFSKINAFLLCPYRYKLNYIQRKKSRPKIAFDFGKTIHSVLENYHKIRFFYDIIPLLKRNKSQLSILLKKLWINDSYPNSEIEKMYFEKAEEMLSNYFKQFVKNKPINIYSIESFIKIEINSNKIIGFIDRIDIIGKNEFEIIDYKTENMVYQENDIINDLQMKIYYLAAKEFLKINPVKISIFNLAHNRKVSILPHQYFNIEDIKKELQEKIKSIETERDFQPQKNKYCYTCDLYNKDTALCSIL